MHMAHFVCHKAVIEASIWCAIRSYLTQADFSTAVMSDLDPYDQYEFSVTMDKAGTCFSEVSASSSISGLLSDLN
jgi:hypothetical protein